MFNRLEMKHPLCDGVQKIRCFPFPEHTFNGKNVMDTVFLMPVTATEDFSLPADKSLLQYARVLLFFEIQIPRPKHKKKKTKLLECAFIEYFDRYTVPGMQLKL